MKSPLFFAKILLFGEYGIIKNSKGLSIPIIFLGGHYNGQNRKTKPLKLPIRIYAIMQPSLKP